MPLTLNIVAALSIFSYWAGDSLMWIIASIPFWTIGGLLFFLGIYGIGAVSLNESSASRFKSVSDANATGACLWMLLASGLLLFIAAKVVGA